MTTTIIDGPAATLRSANPYASGWIPQSPLAWLEELRDEHERLVTARSLAVRATAAVRRAQADLAAEHDAQVAAAARDGDDPPALPGRLDPGYMARQLEAAAEVEEAARRELGELIARVALAVGEHRLGAEWLSATTVDEDAGPDDRRVACAARLRVFEAQWTWPPVVEPGPSLQELDAEVKAATEEVQRLHRVANDRLAAWREAVREAEAVRRSRPKDPPPLPPAPDLDDQLMARTHAADRLGRAISARQEADRGVIA